MSKTTWLLALLVCCAAALCAGCDDDSGGTDAAIPDGPRPDGPGPGDDGQVTPDGTPDGPLADTTLQPDGPKPPAEWKTVPGTGPAVADPTVTLLSDGRVLVTGGYTYKSATSTAHVYHNEAWLYVPDQNVFVAAGTMSVARGGHTASLLPDGRVLIVGGFDDTDEWDTTEIFDPTKPAASAWSAGPKLSGKRFGHSAVTLNDQRVLIAGGASWPSYLASFEIYNPTSSSFQLPATVLKTARRYMAAARLQNGKVLFAGGDDGSSAFSNVLEVYDPASGTVTQLGATLNDKKSAPFAFCLPSGKVMVTAGYAFAYPPKDDLFDPASGTVTALTHPGGSARGSAATLLNDGRVIVAGGFESAQQNKVRVFDEKGLTLDTSLPDMLSARSYFGLVTLKDGSVLAVGGREGSKDTFPAQAERLYHP